jgi:hypothetical protein
MDRKGMSSRELLILIMIPVGVVLFCFFFEIANDYYWQKKVDKTAYNTLRDSMSMESVDTLEEYQYYAEEQCKKAEFENCKVSVVFQDDEKHSIFLSFQIEHFSVTGYIFSKTKFTTSKYTGYMDDYNDPVVTKIEDKIEKDDKIYTEEELEEMETTTSYAQ